MRVPPAETSGFNLQSPGGVGAAVIVNEQVAAGCEELAADGEADTLGTGGDESTLAVELMHGGTGEVVSIASIWFEADPGPEGALS
jgi:hypothetical protein